MNPGKRGWRRVMIIALILFAADVVRVIVVQLVHGSSSEPSGITGGIPVKGEDVRWLAYIRDFRGHSVGGCAGTVITPRLILTAGHCAVSLETGRVRAASGYRVLTGEADVSADRRQVSSVSRVIVYPGYAPDKFHGDGGDAALLVLKTPTSAPAVSLATSAHSLTGRRALLVGWSRTFFQPPAFLEERYTSPEKVGAPQVLQSQETCKAHIEYYDSRSELCSVVPPSYTVRVCRGASGSPLVLASPAGTGTVEIGVAIQDLTGCGIHSPTFYTSVEAIRPWILEQEKALQRRNTRLAEFEVVSTASAMPWLGLDGCGQLDALL